MFLLPDLPQIREMKEIKSFLNMGDHKPEDDLWAKRGVLGGGARLSLI
jgi:hypothetical protein